MEWGWGGGFPGWTTERSINACSFRRFWILRSRLGFAKSFFVKGRILSIIGPPDGRKDVNWSYGGLPRKQPMVKGTFMEFTKRRTTKSLISVPLSDVEILPWKQKRTSSVSSHQTWSLGKETVGAVGSVPVPRSQDRGHTRDPGPGLRPTLPSPATVLLPGSLTLRWFSHKFRSGWSFGGRDTWTDELTWRDLGVRRWKDRQLIPSFWNVPTSLLIYSLWTRSRTMGHPRTMSYQK